MIPLDELAKQAKDELDGIYRPLHEAYTPAFAFPSCFIHASLTDLLGRVETENGLTYIADNKARSPQSTLFHAHLLLLRLFNRLNSHFSLGLNSDVKDALEGFEPCWNPERRPPGFGADK